MNARYSPLSMVVVSLVCAFGICPGAGLAQSVDDGSAIEHAQVEDAQLEEAQVDDEDASARAFFEAGRVAYDAARFRVALENFQAAYEMSRRPELLFNVGLSQERLGDDAAALVSFQTYLETATDGNERATVERRVEVLRGRLERTETAPEPDDVPANRTAGWAVLATGAVLAVGGALALGIGVAKRNSVTSSANGALEWPEAESRFDRGSALTVAGAIGLGVGAALAGVSIVLLRSDGGTRVSTNGTMLFVSGQL